MINPYLPNCMAWYHHQRFQIQKELNAMAPADEDFRKKVVELDEATKAFSKALTRAGNELAGFVAGVNTSVDYFIQSGSPLVPSVIKVLSDPNQPKFKKLPRKQKKAFIRKYGRDEYRRKYGDPPIMLLINTPGGFIID